MVVDCENSDPYKLCATLKNLDYEVMQKITAIILFDDVHTATAWRILENYTRIPVEHIMIERIKQNKSLVDIKLTARACQEHYQKQVDSFVIVPFPVSWTVKMKKKQKETQDILSYHTQAAGCSDKARAKASGGRQPIEECGRTGL